jgi:hypothetical protein
MKKLLLWLLALWITLSTAVYQRLTGPTYPYRGKVSFLGQEIKFKLPRSAENTDNCRVVIGLPETLSGKIQGYLEFKRHRTDRPWNILAMKQEDSLLIGYLPKQAAAGKVEYFVHLVSGQQEISLSGVEPVVIRFKGHVSSEVLVAHIIVMFLGMLFSVRAGLAAINRQENPTKLAQWTAVLIFVGGFILGPIVQKMAFGVFWSGFPLGKDLTDTKILLTMIAWIAALASGRRTQPRRGWVLAASVLTLAFYLIPHSIFGSELKW